MQFGIDAAAHKASLGNTGKTIAVLGVGFNNIFPPENIDLFNKIIQAGGLVISEYEPDREVNLKNFPLRNRIISGLSLGVLVVEARKFRSGASLTATIALKQGKKVFCLPCNVDSKYTGTNKLLLKGATPISTSDEIIEICNIKTEKKSNISMAKKCEQKKKTNILPEYKDIYEILLTGPKSIDEISKKLNNYISYTASTLTMMEIDGLVKELPGKFFETL